MAARFDTRVQELKYRVLKEIARAYFNDNLIKSMYDIPKIIVPGPKPTMRCCIHKERAIVQERIKLACSRKEDEGNVVQVISIACDDCPLGGYTVGSSCRGCIAHRCEAACPKHTITFNETTKQAIINKSNCINCGLCAKACPYDAIENRIRPCEKACKVKAISAGEDGAATIDDEKCVRCGACVYMCPFGAVVDKSYILDVIDLIKDSSENKKYKLYAVVAPSVSSNLTTVKLGQLISGLKKLGFYGVTEAALGADLVAINEASELAHKGKLTSSCCPAFASFIKKNFPELREYISENLSPMATVAKRLKEKDPNCKIVFIGPCVAKKEEIKRSKVAPYVDCAITFEELQALFDAKEIELTSLELSEYDDDASYFGRIFARCGGLSDAVNEALKEQNIDFEAKSVQCDGLDNCKAALLKLKNNTLDGNFIEGMACSGGCIGGPCNLTHEIRGKINVDRIAKETSSKTISDAINKFEN